MNRIQFFVLTGLSSVLALLLFGHIALNYEANKAQAEIAVAQQIATQGGVSYQGLNLLARRIFNDAEKTGDPGLKALVSKYKIQISGGNSTNSTETPASPPSSPTVPSH